MLTGVALRSLDVLDGVVTLAQFRLLAVLADLGRARSAQVARALGLDASTVTRLADRLVAAGHVIRGSDPAHRSVVTLELTASGQDAGRPGGGRAGAGAAAAAGRPAAGQPRRRVTAALRQLVRAAGDGYGVAAERGGAAVTAAGPAPGGGRTMSRSATARGPRPASRRTCCASTRCGGRRAGRADRAARRRGLAVRAPVGQRRRVLQPDRRGRDLRGDPGAGPASSGAGTTRTAR